MLAALLALAARLVGRMPLRAVRALGALVGSCAWALGIRRAHVVASMRRAEIARAPRQARAMYRALGMSVFELLWMAGRRAPMDELAVIDDASRAALARARAAGKGIVVAASHTGNWEAAVARVAEDIPVVAVTKALSVKGFDGFTARARASRGVRTAHAGRVVEAARAILGENGAITMVIDQVPERRYHALRHDFLGAPAWVDRAPAVIAARLGAPLVVAAARRTARGTHALSVLGVHEPPPGADRAWVDAATISATRALERFVREHPSEWLWLHRRWAAPRDQRPTRPPARLEARRQRC